jgi:serine/threonine protein phosphatase PrpC
VAAHDLKIEVGVATLPLPGQQESGDLSLVKRVADGTLIAVVDGLGHGQDAASAAHAAVGALDRYACETLPELVKRCHAALVGLRGVVLGLAFFDPRAATLTWLGVGNIVGYVLRADQGNRPARISLVPIAGFIGAELPQTTPRVVSLLPGDTMVMASDGIKEGFAEKLMLSSDPQDLADQILARHAKGTDDALVLVARYAA